MTGVSIASVAVLLVINATLKFGNTVAAKEEVEDRFLSKLDIEEGPSSLLENKQIKLMPEFGLKLDDVTYLCSQFHVSPEFYYKKTLNPFLAEMYRHVSDFDKRDKFNPWGGKRQGTNNRYPKNDPTGKASFNPWGGR